MSDHKETEEFDQAPSLEIDETVLDEARQEKVAAGAVHHRRKSGVAGFFSLLALLLAGGGLAAGYYLYEHEIKPLKHLPNRVSQLTESGASKQELSELQSRLQIVSAGNETLQSELANAGGEYQSIQAGLAELRKNAGWGQREWSLAEVDYLLNIASQELQLRRDPVTTAAALKGAIRRLDTLADPELGSLRKQIMLDIQSVENYQIPEAEEVLANLLSAAAGLQPLPEPEVRSTQPDSTDDKPLSDMGLRELWDSFRTSLSSRVRVVQHEAPLNALTQQGVEAYKVDILKLRIEILRLALLRHDAVAFKRELSALSRWVDQALPAKQAGIILSEIDHLQQLEFSPLPELHANVTGYLQQDDVSQEPSADTVPVEPAPAEPASDMEAIPQETQEAEPVPPESTESEHAPVSATDDSAEGAQTEQTNEAAQPLNDTPAELQELDRLLQQLEFEQQQGAPQ